MKRLIVLVLASVFAFGCPYYNTFYNAKKAFNEAEKLRKDAQKQGITQVPEQAKRLYERAIENSALLMRDHPHSDLIDDALVLIGDAFTVQGEYPKAIRKFEEVLANYPDSKWFPYCTFALGRTALSAGDTLRGEEVLRNFLVQFPASEWAPDAHMLLGTIDINRQDYSTAIDDYTDFLTSFPKHKRRPEAQYFIAESYLELDRHTDALELFEQVGKTARTRELEYQARYMVGECLRRDQAYEQALETFDELVRKSSYLTYRPKTMLAIAACQVALDRTENALEIYQEINERYERDRTYEAEVSEALFEIGRIHEQEGDLEQAEQFYIEAGKRSPRLFWVSSAADQKGNDIRLLQRYREDLASAQAALVPVPPDSGQTEEASPRIDPKALEKVIETRFKLAEVYLFQFDLIDSALVHYRLAEEEAGEGELAAKAAYATAWVMEHVLEDTSSSRIGYQNVLSEYDSTVYASAAARAIAVPDPMGLSESELFAKAENLLFEAEASDSAAVYYQLLLDRFPEGPFAPRSLYALGWIAETYRQDTESALEMYRELKASFPRTEASEAANLKIKYIEEWLAERDAADSLLVADTGTIDNKNEHLLDISPEDRHGEVVEVDRDRIVISLREVVPAEKGGTGYLFTMDGSDSSAVPVRAALFQVMQANLPEGPRMGANTANNTNLYANAGDRIIAMIPPNKPFEVLSEEGDWFQVRLDGQDGYVHREFVQVDPLVEPTIIGRIEERYPAWAPDEWLGAVIDIEAPEATADSMTDSTATESAPVATEVAASAELRDGDVVQLNGDQVVVKLRSPMPVAVGDTGYLIAMDSGGDRTAKVRVAQVRLPDLGMGTVIIPGQLRSTPNGDILLALPNSITVVVLSEEDDWFKVRVGSNEGYIESAHVRMMPPPLPYNGRISEPEMTLREAPGGPVSRPLQRDMIVKVLDVQGKWLRVNADGQEGFVDAGGIMPEPMSDALVFCFIEEHLATASPETHLGAVFDKK